MHTVAILKTLYTLNTVVYISFQLRAFSSKVTAMLEKEASSAAVVTKLESLSKVMAAVKPAVMAKAIEKIEKVDKEVLAKFKDADLTPEQVMMALVKMTTTKTMVVMMMIMLFAMVMYNHDDYTIALMVIVLDVISYLIVTNDSF